MLLQLTYSDIGFLLVVCGIAVPKNTPTKLHKGKGHSLEALLVLPGVDLCDNLLELSLCLALREVLHVVVLRSNPEQDKT